MKIILQKVCRASVSIDEMTVSSIDTGYVLLLGVEKGDTEIHADWLVDKICKLRLFEGENGKINDRSIIDYNGQILVVSQFTLAGDLSKGSRPDYTNALDPKAAKELYQYVITKFQAQDLVVQTGEFGAQMQVELINDGPVTLLLER